MGENGQIFTISAFTAPTWTNEGLTAAKPTDQGVKEREKPDHYHQKESPVEWRLRPLDQIEFPRWWQKYLQELDASRPRPSLAARLEEALGPFKDFKAAALRHDDTPAATLNFGQRFVGLELPTKNGSRFDAWEKANRALDKARSRALAAKRAAG